MKRLTLVAAFLAALLVATATLAGAATGRSSAGGIELQILAVSDWHAQLDPVEVSTGTFAGGASVISGYWQKDREAVPNTLTLTAGDAYGAAPPLSGFFNEEPGVLAMRMMGIEVDTFGNHNWDRGNAHLQSMIDLASKREGDAPGKPFRYVAANLKNVESNLTGVDKLAWFRKGGLKIAVIGAVNEEAPTLVRPGALGTIEITDAAEAVNKRAEVARKAGADLVVVITHKGVRSITNGVPTGELIDLANAAKGVDVIMGDHTDVQYSGVHNNVLVVESRSKGVSYSKTKLVVDPDSNEVLERSVTFVTPLINNPNITRDAAIESMLAPYRAILAPILNEKVGDSTRAIPRADSCGTGNGRTCESLIGNVITDALRSQEGTQIALTNSGGIRANLTCPTTDLPTDFCPAFTPPPYPITKGQVLTVLPFGNFSVTLMLSGAELKGMLEHGVGAMPGVNGRFPQVSGLCFTYDISKPAGSRVTSVVWQGANGACTTNELDLTTTAVYTMATNDFTAGGGDAYQNFTGRFTSRALLLEEVTRNYIAAAGTISPTLQGRIKCVDGDGPGVGNDCPVTIP